MPSPILTQAATITCSHGGQVVAIPQNVTVQIMGSPVLVMTDVFTIAGCPFSTAAGPQPCLNIQWSTPAVSTTVKGVPVLLATSTGICMGAGPPVPAIVIPGQLQVLGN